MDQNQTSVTPPNGQSWAKFIIFSLIGIIAFFVPFQIGDTRSIPIDLISRLIIDNLPLIVAYYALLMMLIGAVWPFFDKSWNKNAYEVVYTFIKVLGFILGLLIFIDVGPQWIRTEEVGRFLFFELVISIGLIVPISALFLHFLTGYGLVEFLGVLFQRIMKPIWNVPGRSAIYAITSRFASIVVVYLMVSNDYKDNRLTLKEATIIATGFLAVEIPFMIIIARTLDIMAYFPLFFVAAIFTSFLVTAILARFWPFRGTSDEYYEPGKGEPEPKVEGQMVKNAFDSATRTASTAENLPKGIWKQLEGALIMTTSVLPAIMAIGLIFLLLTEYTPIFDYIAYIFYPLTMALQAPEPLLTAKAITLGITEILLPSLIVVDAMLATKFIVGIVSISGILFFSTSIPCILSSYIPISIGRMVLIWFMRTILSLIIAVPLVYLIL